MELMHLSPPLMEKLEADLVLLQKKYGLVSQALTPARLAHQDASTVQADLLSSKQAALGTFVSPLRHNNVNHPLVLRTEVPCALRAMNSPSPNQLPPSLSTNYAQISKGAIPAREIAAPACEIAAPAREIVATALSARPTATATVTSTVPDSRAREIATPAAQNGIPLIPTPAAQSTVPPMAQFMESSDSVRRNAPLRSAFARGKAHSTVPPIIHGNPRGSAPHAAQIGTVSAQIGTVSAQMCSEPNRGNAPTHYSATQGSVPVQGSSWAARLGGSRSTSSTTLSYIPPTVIAGK